MEDYFIFISTENERVCMKRGRMKIGVIFSFFLLNELAIRTVEN